MYDVDKPLLYQLAQFAHALQTQDIPSTVLTEAKYCLLDTLGCMVAGSVLPEGQDFFAIESKIDVGGKTRVFGSQQCFSELAASRINAYWGDILELNDLIGGHASIGSVSAMLAMADNRKISGEKALRALVTGIEVTARVNLAYRESNDGKDNKPFTEVGISSEGIPSTIGCAALASVILELDIQQTFAALGIAATLAGWCPVEVLFGEGGSVKPMMFGAWPSSVGIQAALYAQHGMTGPTHLLESPVGLYATLAKGFDAEILRGSRGWQLNQPRRKWHACCGFIHAGIDGIMALRETHGVPLFDDARIQISVVPPVVQVLSGNAFPTNTTQARFSGKYCVALAALNPQIHRITPEHMQQIQTFQNHIPLHRLFEKIEYVADESLPHFSHSIVTVIGSKGQTTSHHVAGYQGSQFNPLSHEQVLQKFSQLTTPVVQKVDALIENVLDLEKLPHLDAIFALDFVEKMHS